MDKIKNVAQRLGIITVEDMERYTALELIMMIANKMNEFKETLNVQNDKIQYLLNEGLLSEVEQILNEWLQDGTLDTLINQLSRISIYSASQLGIVGDGETDDTIAINNAINLNDNITVRFESDKTFIITDILKSNKNGVNLIFGKNSKIKLKDNSGLLNKVANGVYNEPPALITLFGDNCRISGCELDGNIDENFITKDDEKYYAMYEFSNYGFKNNFGYSGICINGNNNIVEYCHVHDMSWGGIDKKSYDENFQTTGIKTSNNVIRFNKIERVGRDGITLHSSNGCEIYGNELKDNSWHDIHDYYKGTNNVIRDNVITFDKYNIRQLYPRHFTNQGKNYSIVIDHSAYRDSEVSNTRVENNKIKGNHDGGIITYGYPRGYNIIQNEIEVVGTGINTGFSLDENNIRGNIIKGTKGIVFGFNVTYSTQQEIYPTYLKSSDLNFTLNINQNKFINCDNPIWLSVKRHNSNDEDIISRHLNSGKIEITSNSFISDVVKKEAITFYLDTFDIDNLKVICEANTNVNYEKIVNRNYVLYVDAVNGADTNKGSLSSPFRTITKSLLQIPNIFENSYTIRLLTDTSEDVVLKNINSPMIDNFKIEGWDKATDNNVIRKTGQLTLIGCGNLILSNLKPVTTNDTNLVLNQNGYIRLISIDLTDTNNRQCGLKVLNGTNCFISSISIQNKETAIIIENLSKCMLLTNAGNFTGCTTIFKVNTGSSLHSAYNISSTSKELTNGGFVVNNDGEVITQSLSI